MRNSVVFFVCVLLAGLASPVPLQAGEIEFARIEGCFKNFFHCEMARKDGDVYFDKKPFEIVETHVSDIRQEGDLLIVAGTVTCWVEKKHQILYSALGIRKILEHEQVRYMTTRQEDFSILASEITRFPYKRGCPWVQFWLNQK